MSVLMHMCLIFAGFIQVGIGGYVADQSDGGHKFVGRLSTLVGVVVIGIGVTAL